ncbi:hypothetical protein WDW37_06860 [Bdellovibrionota bacterium FG-1]
MLFLLLMIAVLVGLYLVYKKQVALEERLDRQSGFDKDDENFRK